MSGDDKGVGMDSTARLPTEQPEAASDREPDFDSVEDREGSSPERAAATGEGPGRGQGAKQFDVGTAVEVDFGGANTQPMKNLHGTVRGPITTTNQCASRGTDPTTGEPIPVNPYADVTPIYRKIGIHSMRTNADGMATSRIFSTTRSAYTWLHHIQTGTGADQYTENQVFPDDVCNDHLHQGIYDSWEEWLTWLINPGEEQYDDNYIVSPSPQSGLVDDAGQEVQSEFDRIGEIGELYYKTGEFHYGPKYFSRSSDTGSVETGTERPDITAYGAAAATVLRIMQEQSSNGTIPAFVEIGDEPNGSKYKGPFVAQYDGSNTDIYDIGEWAADFREWYVVIRQAVLDMGFPGPIGGCGFTRLGVKSFLKYPQGNTKVGKILQWGEPNQLQGFDFISFHWYPAKHDLLTPYEGPFSLTDYEAAVDLDGLTDLCLDFPADVVAFREELDVHASDIPLHISEWNLAEQILGMEYARARKSPLIALGIENLADSHFSAVFASAVLGWMQNSRLGISHSNQWCGRWPTGGLVETPALVNWEQEVTVNPTAFAFFLHQGLADRWWAPVQISNLALGTADDVVDAAEAGFRVTALAAGTDSYPHRYTIIVTNLDFEDRDAQVTIRPSGLSPATYDMTVQQFGRLPVEPIVESEIVPIGPYAGWHPAPPPPTEFEEYGRLSVPAWRPGEVPGQPTTYLSSSEAGYQTRATIDEDELDDLWPNLTDTRFPSTFEEGDEIKVLFHSCAIVRIDLVEQVGMEEIPGQENTAVDYNPDWLDRNVSMVGVDVARVGIPEMHHTVSQLRLQERLRSLGCYVNQTMLDELEELFGTWLAAGKPFPGPIPNGDLREEILAWATPDSEGFGLLVEEVLADQEIGDIRELFGVDYDASVVASLPPLAGARLFLNLLCRFCC